MGVILKRRLAYLFYSFFFISFNSLAQSAPAAVTFKKGTIKINKITLKVEFALNQEQHIMGLMNRTEIPDDFGMLFIFEKEDYHSFWMKNTYVDLSIAYIDTDKRIFQILDMKAAKSSTDANLGTYPSSKKAKYALEVKQGWFEKNKIKVGDALKKINIK